MYEKGFVTSQLVWQSVVIEYATYTKVRCGNLKLSNKGEGVDIILTISNGEKKYKHKVLFKAEYFLMS